MSVAGGPGTRRPRRCCPPGAPVQPSRVRRAELGISRSAGPGRLHNVTVDRPFEDIVTEYGPMVLRVCRAIVGPIEAEDAWSETFLSALRAYPDLAADTNIEAWLVRIAQRRAIDVGRAISR